MLLDATAATTTCSVLVNISTFHLGEDGVIICLKAVGLGVTTTLLSKGLAPLVPFRVLVGLIIFFIVG